MSRIRILFIGDIVGEPGRNMFQKHISSVCEQYKIDAVVVNGENSHDKGRGITPKIAEFFKQNNVDMITSGNHIWYSREIYPYLDKSSFLLRPANFPAETPGTGVGFFECKGIKVAVINVLGRIFIRENVECPFKSVESLLQYAHSKTNIVFVDMHAEATSEKTGMGYFCDGKVSGVVGTHTHIPTADERILPKGTAYITDLGMTGALNSMLGMKSAPIIQHFKTQMPTRFSVEAEGPMVMYGAWIEVDIESGKATDIERIKIID